MIKTFIALLFSCALFANTQSNNIPSRLQWMHNFGYCGEVSLISAGLYYGQYLSQYDVRALSTKDRTQTGGQLLIGENDTTTTDKMHLQTEEWDTDSQENTDQFLIWLKQKIVNGNPVAIGVYANQYIFYSNPDPNAGDSDYDHIVSVVSLSSNHSLNDPSYYGDDQVGFSDNGYFDNASTPVYYFSYAFDPFQATRAEANAPSGPIYSLSNDGSNYGIAITGVKDLNGDTLPVRIDTDYTYENPSIAKQSNSRPKSMPLTLTITISNLEPNTPYILYRYDNLASVPDSEFNANANKAFEHWPFQITTGSMFVKLEKIHSNETAVYRCVKMSAP